MSLWFWLTTIYELLWWFLPLEVAQTSVALYAVLGILIYIILEDLAPTDQPSYVPRKRRRYSNRLHTAFFGILGQCRESIEASINNLKVRRRYHPPRIRYTGQRPRRKKCKCIIHTNLTGMTTTWENRRSPLSKSFDSDSQMLMLEYGAYARLHHEEHQRFYGVTQKGRPKGKGDQGSRTGHPPRHSEMVHRR